MNNWPMWTRRLDDDGLCCMTRQERFNLLYGCHFAIPSESTFIELKRPRFKFDTAAKLWSDAVAMGVVLP